MNNMHVRANKSVVAYAAAMAEISSEEWCWDRRDETQMSLEENGRRVRKRDGGGPDYSGCIGDTIFERGEHSWDLKVEGESSGALKFLYFVFLFRVEV